MALCRTCRNPIPCHCHVTPATEIRPGVYAVTNPYPAQPDRAALHEAIAALFRHRPGVERLGDATPGEIADAVQAVIPEFVDRAECEELRRKLAASERIRENADFHLGQEMARRQLAEKETARLRAELAAIPAPTDRAALRDAIAEALMRWAERNNDPKYAPIRRPDTVTQNAYGRADAVLAVIPEPADRAAVDRVRALHVPSSYPNPDGPGEITYCLGCEYATGGHPCNTLAALDEKPDNGPSRMADEAQQPETQGPRCDVEFVGGDQCTKRAGHWTPKTQDPHTPGPVDKQPEPAVVAYRNPDRPSVLLCRQHGDGWWGLTPLTSDDLPDGGTCTFGDPADPGDVCGVDVLIPQQPTA